MAVQLPQELEALDIPDGHNLLGSATSKAFAVRGEADLPNLLGGSLLRYLPVEFEQLGHNLRGEPISVAGMVYAERGPSVARVIKASVYLVAFRTLQQGGQPVLREHDGRRYAFCGPMLAMP